MRDTATFIATAALAALLVASAGCGGSDESAGKAAERDAGEERQTEATFEPFIAPDVLLERLDGTTVQISEYRGKFVLLAFFTTWNKDTAKLMPIMADINRRFYKNVNVLCVALDRGKASAVRSYFTANPVDVPIFVGGEKIVGDFGGYRAVPTVYVLMRDGEVFERIDGLKLQRHYEEVLIKLISHRL
ncbi:MAG: TlpA family protein disulfide reductase [Candidatus Krumholzibacteriota bacterium]|nr:TlpA family protein disulfide reductase [Candidatus Krumholzibacteriota bacterium]